MKRPRWSIGISEKYVPTVLNLEFANRLLAAAAIALRLVLVFPWLVFRLGMVAMVCGAAASTEKPNTASAATRAKKVTRDIVMVMRVCVRYSKNGCAEKIGGGGGGGEV